MFLLANDGISASQWVLLAFILVLIILYPIFTVYKNKKEKEKFDDISKNLQIGDKILTSSGTYGEIVAISEREYGKVLTIKTGDENHVGYMSVDILTVYSVFRDEPVVPVAMEEVKEEEIEVEITEEPALEEKVEVKEEIEKAKKPAAKKSSQTKKTTTAKTKK